eukprot:2156117-Amphidinium_carterae.1
MPHGCDVHSTTIQLVHEAAIRVTMRVDASGRGGLWHLTLHEDRLIADCPVPMRAEQVLRSSETILTWQRKAQGKERPL